MRRMITSKQIESLDKLNDTILVNENGIGIHGSSITLSVDTEADDRYIDFGSGTDYVGATEEGLYLDSENGISIMMGGDPVATFDENGTEFLMGGETVAKFGYEENNDIYYFQFNGYHFNPVGIVGIIYGESTIDYGAPAIEDVNGQIVDVIPTIKLSDETLRTTLNAVDWSETMLNLEGNSIVNEDNVVLNTDPLQGIEIYLGVNKFVFDSSEEAWVLDGTWTNMTAGTGYIYLVKTGRPIVLYEA